MSKKEQDLNETEIKTVSIGIKYPVGLVEEIDKYQRENHINSRTAAIFELLRIGLGKLERK